MRIGTKVKDHNGEVGRIAEVFYDLIPIHRNRYHNSRKVISAYLIKVSEKHFLYRSREKVRKV